MEKDRVSNPNLLESMPNQPTDVTSHDNTYSPPSTGLCRQ